MYLRGRRRPCALGYEGRGRGVPVGGERAASERDARVARGARLVRWHGALPLARLWHVGCGTPSIGRCDHNRSCDGRVGCTRVACVCGWVLKRCALE